MARHDVAKVLDVKLPLNHREAQIAQHADQRGQQRNQQQPHHIDLHRNAKLGAAPLKTQRRQDVEHHAGDKPSDHALHRLVRADQRAQLVLAEGPPGKVGSGVAEPGAEQRQQQVIKPQGVAVVVPQIDRRRKRQRNPDAHHKHQRDVLHAGILVGAQQDQKQQRNIGQQKQRQQIQLPLQPDIGKSRRDHKGHRRKQLIVADFGRCQKLVHRHQDDDHDRHIQDNCLKETEHDSQQNNSHQSRNDACFHKNLSVL